MKSGLSILVVIAAAVVTVSSSLAGAAFLSAGRSLTPFCDCLGSFSDHATTEAGKENYRNTALQQN